MSFAKLRRRVRKIKTKVEAEETCVLSHREDVHEFFSSTDQPLALNNPVGAGLVPARASFAGFTSVAANMTGRAPLPLQSCSTALETSSRARAQALEMRTGAASCWRVLIGIGGFPSLVHHGQDGARLRRLPFLRAEFDVSSRPPGWSEARRSLDDEGAASAKSPGAPWERAVARGS